MHISSTDLGLAAHIRTINDELAVCGCALVDDLEHWHNRDVYTAEQLDHYLAVEAYINVYKDEHGIKPRHINFNELTTKEIEDMIDKL